MRNFACTKCGNRVFFENVVCLKCSHPVGFHVPTMAMAALDGIAGSDGLFRNASGKNKEDLRYCSNAAHGVCNWLAASNDESTRCVACDLNRTIPNLAVPGNLKAWSDLERAKKRLVYALLRFGLPLDCATNPPGRLTFDFAHNAGTSHLDGVITIDALEADAVWRERQRQRFDEPYRSLLGHLRHESGHFYWMVLVETAGRLDEFRTIFGDERLDYKNALALHHAEGAPADWYTRYVSAYASSHPWEDWAETWAHYLHMTDALDTAEASGLEPRAAGLNFGSIWPFKRYDIYREESLAAMIERWIPLTIAMNSLSRSMGHDDYYPFVIPSAASEKLGFVHRVIREHAGGR
ncbi:MAG: putative zinc-binding metallopeptidase [Hyphomicrobium sp.]